jgi:hypothetical protein
MRQCGVLIDPCEGFSRFRKKLSLNYYVEELGKCLFFILLQGFGRTLQLIIHRGKKIKSLIRTLPTE